MPALPTGRYSWLMTDNSEPKARSRIYIGYHTQEWRGAPLTEPKPSKENFEKKKKQKNWLGKAFYFWHHIEHAHMWGVKSKCWRKHGPTVPDE